MLDSPGASAVEQMQMKALLAPAPAPTHRLTAVGVLLLLVLSATAVFVAPLVMPESYFWVSNVISESAAQNVHGAWIARLGFLLFGFAVLWLSISSRSMWARGAYWFHVGFGVFMVSTAAFSHRPWVVDVPFDWFEDLLHSVTATGMGFAFAFGVLVRLLQRRRSERYKRAFDGVAILAAVLLPVSGGLWASVGGFTQRLMFLVAYLWYGNEAMLARRLAGRERAANALQATPASGRGWR